MAHAPRVARLKSSGTSVFLHPCSVCGKDAGFGSGVRLSEGRLGTWYCRDHRPSIHPKPAQPQPTKTAAGQGALF